MIDVADYCRQLEAYLCRKNGGHLVRIVGPAFDRVCAWAERGVPLAVAYRGVDRYCERLELKGTRRRPVRIEFCEADILDIYDDWRRAVGIVQSAPDSTAENDSASVAAPRPALGAHLERVVARLVGRRTRRSPAFEQHVERLLAEIDRLSGPSQRSRGHARAEILDRLAELDRELVAAATAELDADAVATVRREAEAEVAPVGDRLAAGMKAQAIDAIFERLVRESLGLPTIRYQ